MGDLARGAHVGHAHRLAAARVVGDGQHDAGDTLAAETLDRVFERNQVHVALEGMDQPRLAALGDHQVARLGARVLDMGPRGVEMGVVEHHFARPRDVGEEHVLRRTALVRGDHVLKARDIAHGGLKLVERRRARIGLIAGDHARPLARGHRPGAAVGQQVDQHVARLEQERVVPGRLQRRLTLRHGRKVDRLDRAHAKRLDDGLRMEFLHGKETSDLVGGREAGLRKKWYR